MVKNILKQSFFVIGLIMFIIGISKFYHVDYFFLTIIGMISLALGWKYPKE